MFDGHDVQVICGRCKLTINADIPVVGKMKLTICSLCSLAINRSALPDTAGSEGDRGLGTRPFSSGPSYQHRDCDDEPAPRKRALSLNSFHTANFDQTSLQSSVLAHDF